MVLGDPLAPPERTDATRYAPRRMTDTPRTRRDEETRPCQLRLNAVANAAGSAYLEQGRTKILAAVYGPRQAERNALAQLSVELQIAQFAQVNKEVGRKRSGDLKVYRIYNSL